MEPPTTLEPDQPPPPALPAALLDIDIAELMYTDHREGPAGRLRRQGWAVSWTSATDFAEAYGRDLDQARFGGIATFVRATKPAPLGTNA